MSISFSPAWSDKIKVASVGSIVTFISIISTAATVFENAVRLEVWWGNYCSWCWHNDARLSFPASFCFCGRSVGAALNIYLVIVIC